MENRKMVPEIRFSGFTDPWEQRKLGDVGTTYTGLSGKTKEDFGHGNGKFVTYMNVFSNTVGLPDMVEPVEIDDTQNKVLYGDVLFTTSSETPEEVGMSSVWLENAENTYLNSFCFGYRPTVEFNPYYLAYMLRSFSMREKIKFLAQGISRYNISKNKMMYIEIPIPNIEEQEQIGTYFRTINNLITLHQRKLEKLKTFKKAMLDKMFPKNGELVPEIRFSGFTDPWEQRKLEGFVDKAVDNRGKTPPLDECGSHPLIEVAALGGVHPNYSKIEKYLSDDSFENSLRAYIKKGDILFATVGSIGLVSLMDSRNEAAIAQNIVAFRAKENFVPEYLYALFTNEGNQYKAKRIVMGAVQPSIKVSQLVNVEYTLTTNNKEQKEIGVYFSYFDHLITLHQRKLEKLQNIKKSMLNKMFI